MLEQLLQSEKENTRQWLRCSMDLLVDPLVEELFDKLKSKLVACLAGDRTSANWSHVPHMAGDHVNSGVNHFAAGTSKDYCPDGSGYAGYLADVSHRMVELHHDGSTTGRYSNEKDVDMSDDGSQVDFHSEDGKVAQAAEQCITLEVKCFYPNCAEMFSNKNQLNDHMLRGHSVGQFRCVVRNCNKSFIVE